MAPLAIHIHKRLFCPLNNCEFTFNDGILRKESDGEYGLKRGLNVEEKGGDNKTCRHQSKRQENIRARIQRYRLHNSCAVKLFMLIQWYILLRGYDIRYFRYDIRLLNSSKQWV